MRAIFLFTALLLALTAMAETTRYDNGYWFDGERFRPGSLFVVDGQFSTVEPASVDRVVDLGGGFVLPPFADAHNHDLASSWELDQRIAEYLEEGVFYAKMQSAFSPGIDEVRAQLNRPDSVDVTFAFAPVTGPGGHPIKLRETFFDRGHYQGVFATREEIAGIGYTLVTGPEDLEAKWPALLAQEPDFIKFMLSSSEEYALRRDDPEFFGRKGLDPALAPRLVELAHGAGLRVSAHVDTAADFHHAVRAGVDEIVHLPGPHEPEIIRQADADLAADKGTVVLTTISLSQRHAESEPELYARLMAHHKRNLERLRDAGVTIAIGSDMPFRDHSVEEAIAVHGLDVFTNAELLRIWCEVTPRQIFPDRKIGRIADGFEASFIVLDANPLEDFEAVRNVRYRVKQGHTIELGE